MRSEWLEDLLNGGCMDTQVSTSVFKIQVGGAPGGAQVMPESASEDFIDGTADKLSSVAAAVELATGAFMERLEELKFKPAECVLEFGVNVGGEAGVPFITKGTIGANFKVALKWTWK